MCQGICKNRKDYFDTWKLSKRQFTKTVFAITVPKRLGIDYNQFFSIINCKSKKYIAFKV